MSNLEEREDLTTAFQPMVDWLAREKEEGDHAQGKTALFPPEKEHERNQIELGKLVQTTLIDKIEAIESGLALLFDRLDREDKKSIQGECEEVFKVIVDYVAHFSLEKSVINEPIQTFLGFSDETLRIFYAIGYQCFQENEAKEALQIFSLLTFLNPLIGEFWLGKGMTEERLGLLEDALVSCSFANTIRPEDPAARYYMALALIGNNRKEEAQEMLKEWIPTLKEQENTKWKKRAIKLKKQLRSTS